MSLAKRHDHGHGGLCGGLDHHSGDYTAAQRRDLDLVLDFNRAMTEAINAGRDVRATEAYLDPDPMRYMWVDEGQGRIAEQIAGAHRLLAEAPELPGMARDGVEWVQESARAARPSIASSPDGMTLTAWLEWVPEQGEVLRARVETTGAADAVMPGRDDSRPGRSESSPAIVVEEVTTEPIDLFRPVAVIDGTGTCWVLVGRRNPDSGHVAVWAYRRSETGWGKPEAVSHTDHPSFNQEVAVTADGGLEVCWQARDGARFAIFARSHGPGGWGETRLVSAGAQGNVWDPSVTTLPDGGTAYAWSEYAEGSYRVVLRTRGADGVLSEPRPLTGGTDYALHPSLASTGDGRLWCAFDLITVHAHGGSGPTRLRAVAEVGTDPAVIDGVRASGASVPSELLPDVAASIRVVEVLDHGVREAPGGLAEGLDVVPSGLPKLVATADGGLGVAYRVHRRLPLMTYYWEVAAQVLGPDGWEPPTTFSGSDGTLEEPSVAASADGLVVAAQMDRRLERALTWTEGFGGRECPYLYEHHGAVIWHGIHGLGQIVLAGMSSAGPVWTPPKAAREPLVDVGERGAESAQSLHGGIVESADRTEARRWADRTERTRHTTHLDGEEMTLYWGDLHRHSLVSRCTSGDEPSLEDFYRYAWDVCDYDFWAVTDHAENSSEHQWWGIQKIADLFHIPGVFVPLYGFEWTSADTGHQNVIFGDVARGAPSFSAFAEGTTDPAGLWRALAEHPSYPAITIPHHPGSAMVHNDWDYHDPRYSRLVEIFQACRGNYESDRCFRQYSDGTATGTFTVDGLLRGHRFGFVGSSDHGHGASYVGAYARSLERAEVFDALQARRTFAATTRDVTLDVRMTGGESGQAFLGEEVVIVGARTLHIRASGYADLARVEVVRDGELVHVVEPDIVSSGEVALGLRVEWGQAEGATVWDGALRVSGGRVLATPYWSPEVVSVEETQVSWQATTHSFGEPYGAQRGAAEMTLLGPPAAEVEVRVGERTLHTTLAAVQDAFARDGELVIPGPAHALGELRLQPSVGGLTSLGVRELEVEWTDPSVAGPPPGASGQATFSTATFYTESFYYVRLYQVDGEMAWSSPIWVLPPGAESLAKRGGGAQYP